MSDKLVGGIVTAVAIAPICAVCVLGPALVGSILAGGLTWLGDVGLFAAVVIAATAGTLLFAARLRRKTREQKIPARIDQPDPLTRGPHELDVDR